MWDCVPGAREEAVLRQGFLAAHPDAAAQVTASGTVTLESKLDGARQPGLGLLAVTDAGLVYFTNEDTQLTIGWPEISHLKVTRRLFGRRISVSSGGQTFTFGDESGQLAPLVQRAWRDHRAGDTPA